MRLGGRTPHKIGERTRQREEETLREAESSIYRAQKQEKNGREMFCYWELQQQQRSRVKNVAHIMSKRPFDLGRGWREENIRKILL